VLLRVENLDDRFDKVQAGIKYVNLTRFARQLYKHANPRSLKEPKPLISETSITNNQLA